MGLQATIPNQGQGKRAKRALDLVWLRLSGPAHSPRPLASIPLSAYSVGRRSALGLVEEAPNMERQRGVFPRLQSTAAPSLGRISGRKRPLFQRAPQRLFERITGSATHFAGFAPTPLPSPHPSGAEGKREACGHHCGGDEGCT